MSPRRGALAYPISLAFGKSGTSAPQVLYVLNSNSALTYNAGKVQAFDLGKIAKKVAPCRRLGVTTIDAGTPPPDGGLGGDDAGASAPDAGLADGGVGLDAGAPPLGSDVDVPPGYDLTGRYATFRGVLCDGLDTVDDARCCFDEDELDQFFVGGPNAAGAEILIDSFASGLALSPDAKRLYATVRSRGMVLYLDILKDGQLSCGGDRGVCERGTTDRDRDRDPVSDQPPHPTAIVSGKVSDLLGSGGGTYVATAHETGEVSLFLDRKNGGPVLESVLLTHAPRLTSLTADPTARLLYATTNSRSASVERVGVHRLNGRLVLYGTTSLALTQVASAFDTRDIALDARDPQRLFILMRGVAQSVVFARIDSTTSREVQLEGEVRVGSGPSKMTQATLGGRRLLLVSCYDARAVFVIDQDSRALVSVIRGFSGPFEMAVDEPRALLFVADYRANVLRVVDVAGLGDRRLPPPRIVATLGDLSFAGELSQ